MPLQNNYLSEYHNLKLTRDDKGVLVAEFHTNGGPFIMTAQSHTGFVDAFYRIAQDRANKIVILTGAGAEFITDVDWSSFGDVTDPGVWSQVHDEGVQVLENMANIRVPVIAAIVREVGYGLSLEGASSAALAKSLKAKSEPVARKGKSA